jgi:hypothetical protein
MGVDLYYCEDCRECVHSDDFRRCIVCCENCELCDHCDSDLLVDFLNNKHHFVCEPCIIDYKNIDFDGEYIKDFINDNGVSKDEVIIALTKRYDDEYTIEKRISKLQCDVKTHEEQIKELKRRIKSLNKNKPK